MFSRAPLAVAGAMLSAALLPALSLSSLPAAASPDVAAAPAAANPALVNDHVLFTKDDHTALTRHARTLIDAVPRGARISLPLYYFNRDEIVTALIAAHRRGVDVRIVINGSETGKAQFKALKAAKMNVTVCGKPIPNGSSHMSDRGCIANRSEKNDPDATAYSRLHNKFMTLSKVSLSNGDVAQNVVWLASANFDHTTAYEDSFTFRNTEVYGFYRAYFDHMRYYAGTPGKKAYGTNARDSQTTTADGMYKAHFFPRHEATGQGFFSGSNDPIVAAVGKAKCSTKSTGDVISVANFRISRRPVVSALKAAKKRGCTIRVVTGDVAADNGKPYAALVDLDKAVGVRVCGPATRKSYMHEKFLTITDGKASQLYLGSQNFTYAALRQQDENVLRVANPKVVAKYADHFQSLHGYCPTWNASTFTPTTPQDMEMEMDE
ncbi:phospholipase D-like domain-containing protein [Actinomadura sp. B10D3]|uniref:phospholipase D-like domain-containing protein n=1 Tax=Actinomadura sp. B10D3 TaxID=3153557 RepID=UPI00325DC6BB